MDEVHPVLSHCTPADRRANLVADPCHVTEEGSKDLQRQKTYHGEAVRCPLRGPPSAIHPARSTQVWLLHTINTIRQFRCNFSGVDVGNLVMSEGQVTKLFQLSPSKCDALRIANAARYIPIQRPFSNPMLANIAYQKQVNAVDLFRFVDVVKLAVQERGSVEEVVERMRTTQIKRSKRDMDNADKRDQAVTMLIDSSNTFGVWCKRASDSQRHPIYEIGAVEGSGDLSLRWNTLSWSVIVWKRYWNTPTTTNHHDNLQKLHDSLVRERHVRCVMNCGWGGCEE